MNPSSVQNANRVLMQVERAFLLPGGLPQRAWFRHAFYALGVYTGYSAVILPGVREAVARQAGAHTRPPRLGRGGEFVGALT